MPTQRLTMHRRFAQRWKAIEPARIVGGDQNIIGDADAYRGTFADRSLQGSEDDKRESRLTDVFDTLTVIAMNARAVKI